MICSGKASAFRRWKDGRQPGRSPSQRRAAQLARARGFALRVRRELTRLGIPGDFDVTLTDDAEIARLNRDFRGKDAPTDVLSFPWQSDSETIAAAGGAMAGFLGDIVISVETAQSNAAAENHPVETEIYQLILHGALHLAGYDHATDHGEMNAIELRLRRALGIEG